MSEFRGHLLLKELIAALGSTASPEEYMEHLLKEPSGAIQQSATQSSLRHLAQHSPNPEAFRSRYEELKGKKVDSLPEFVSLLTLISQDKKLREYLHYKAAKASRQATAAAAAAVAASASSSSSPLKVPVHTSGARTGVDFVKENLPEIVNRVKKAGQVLSTNRSSGLNRPKEADKKYRHPNYYAPVAPNRKKELPHMSKDFAHEMGTPLRPLDGIPVASQENILMEELLSVLDGFGGEYIAPLPLTTPHGPRLFIITDTIDLSLQKLVERILPLASCYSVVVRFVEEKTMFEYGPVNGALAGAMKQLLYQYQVFIAQLEAHIRQGNMNLQSLWFYVQPTLRTMEILANVATTINKAGAHGGKVLSLLHEQTSSVGDPKVRNLCLLLTQAASVPYMEILQMWIYKGVIDDPYEEFLVEDNELIQKEELPENYSDDYWEKRYTIRRECIPVFLEKVADVILRTGKYLNVIRQCGKAVKFPQAHEMKYTLSEREYFEAIEQAYHFASQTLLDLLMKENDLMGRLRSVKHYFLHDQGDFIVQLMDMCEGELAKNIDDIVPHRLESLLELALRTSTANSDPYKDDIRAELLPFDLIHQMFKIHGIKSTDANESQPSEKIMLTGLESFSFGYEVKWPVSLVLNHKIKACYQMIFRHLLYCKHVERLLCRVWLSNKVCKTFPVTSSQSYRPAFVLRGRMLNCVQNLQYYMMVEVIEPNWHVFLENMSKVTNVDQVLTCHMDFLCACMKDCMLTNPILLQTVNRLVAICVDFCHFFEAGPTGTAGSTDGPMSLGDGSFEKSMSYLDMQFSAALLGLLNKISELGREDNNDKMLNVLYRLDFNSYYTTQLLPKIAGSEVADVPQTSG